MKEVIVLKCFLICPIGKEGSPERKRSDQLLHHIVEKSCAVHGFEVIRADKISSSGNINTEIEDNLFSADLVIADLTDLNPNVFYELGYRIALKKPTIHLANAGLTLPFDVAPKRTIFYRVDDLDEAEKAKEELTRVIHSISFSEYASDQQTNQTGVDENTEQILSSLREIKDILMRQSPKIRSSYIDILNPITFDHFMSYVVRRYEDIVEGLNYEYLEKGLRHLYVFITDFKIDANLFMKDDFMNEFFQAVSNGSNSLQIRSLARKYMGDKSGYSLVSDTVREG